VTKEFLETVEKNVLSQRPASRVDDSRVDTQCDFGLLMSDHSIFPHGIETCIIALDSAVYRVSVFHLN
jgi:inositol-pentakisphosphate 2-kinase